MAIAREHEQKDFVTPGQSDPAATPVGSHEVAEPHSGVEPGHKSLSPNDKPGAKNHLDAAVKPRQDSKMPKEHEEHLSKKELDTTDPNAVNKENELHDTTKGDTAVHPHPEHVHPLQGHPEQNLKNDDKNDKNKRR